jgi:hypothetical protein
VARTLQNDDNYVFAALLTFLDPPRPDTKETIHRAYDYGVDVKMITGDQVLIARETARQLSMGDNISEATGLPEFKVGSQIPKDLAQKFGSMCFEADGFAQVCRLSRAQVLPTFVNRFGQSVEGVVCRRNVARFSQVVWVVHWGAEGKEGLQCVCLFDRSL